MITIEKVNKRPNRGNPPLESDECAEGESPQVIAGDPVLGDLVRVTNGATVLYERYTPPPAAPTPPPRILSKTEFNKYGWAQIGMAAFQKAIERARTFSGVTDTAYMVRAVAQQYDSADTFAKSEVEALGGLLASPGIEILTPEQFGLLTGANWPTS